MIRVCAYLPPSATTHSWVTSLFGPMVSPSMAYSDHGYCASGYEKSNCILRGKDEEHLIFLSGNLVSSAFFAEQDT